MPRTTKKNYFIGVCFLLFFTFNGVVSYAKETLTNHKNVEFQENSQAKYPGPFLKDFLQVFYKKFKSTNTTEEAFDFTLSFTVKASGKLDHILITGLADTLVSETTKNIVQSMKKWKPAKENGIAVDGNYRIPFYILIEDVKAGNSNPKYYAKKEDTRYQPANYPTGIDGFWAEFHKIHGPQSSANFVGDQIKYTIILAIQTDGTVTEVDLKGIQNEKLKETFLDDFIDIITRMKKWNPATYDGTPVKSKLNIQFVRDVEIIVL